MTSANLNKFSPEFRSQPHFRELLNAINQSPYLVAQINQYPGKIVLGPPGSGGFYKRGETPQDDQISIEANRLQDTSQKGAIYWKTLATSLGHELGHALLPDGYPQILSAANPGEAILSGLYAEGVAIRNAYYVSLELNCSMWHDPNNVLKSKFDTLARQHGTNSTEFQLGVHALGLIDTGNRPNSVSPQLDYNERIAFHWVASRIAADLSATKDIDWSRVQGKSVVNGQATTRPSIHYHTGADGMTEFYGELPLKNSNQIVEFAGKTDQFGHADPAFGASAIFKTDPSALSAQQAAAVDNARQTVDRFCEKQQPAGFLEELAGKTLTFLNQTRDAVNTLCEKRGYPNNQGRENMIYALAEAGLAKKMTHVDIAVVNKDGLVSIAQDPAKHTMQLITLDSKVAANTPVAESIQKMQQTEMNQTLEAAQRQQQQTPQHTSHSHGMHH